MDADGSDARSWELAAESIVVKIRWFGIIMGYVLVQTRVGMLHNPSAVRAFLALGAGYAALDTAFHRMGEVVLKRWPLFVALMEALFIALLCYHDTGLDSPFRWYYLLSALCCAIRYRPAIAWTTFGLHATSLFALAAALPPAARRTDLAGWPLTLVILAWTTWASAALAGLLKATGARLERANAALRRHQDELRRRVAEAQARVIHQEKMAAFGLLAAGIAHEVGNPVAALSGLVQVLRRRDPDPYTAAKLDLAAAQLGRIGRTLRDLVDFSRPAPLVAGPFPPAVAVDEALGIARYYPGTKDRHLTTALPPDLPPVHAVRDHLTQVVLNLVLNAVDATAPGGHITISARHEGGWVELSVADDGRGIALADRCRLFQPYFTTKPRGTGLGLFVSRQVAEELGGSLSYRTEPGHGTTFTVRLPAAAPPAAGPRLVPRAAMAEGVAG